MKQKPSSRRRRNSTKSILRLPDLERQGRGVEQPELNRRKAGLSSRHRRELRRLRRVKSPAHAELERGALGVETKFRLGHPTRASKKAEGLGKSLDPLTSDSLKSIVNGDDAGRSIEEFEQLSGQGHS